METIFLHSIFLCPQYNLVVMGFFFFSPVYPYSTTFCKIALYVLTWHFSATTCLKKLRNRLHEFRCLEWAENKAADMNRYERQHLVQSASRRPTCQRDAQFAFMLPSPLSRAQSHTHTHWQCITHQELRRWQQSHLTAKSRNVFFFSFHCGNSEQTLYYVLSVSSFRVRRLVCFFKRTKTFSANPRSLEQPLKLICWQKGKMTTHQVSVCLLNGKIFPGPWISLLFKNVFHFYNWLHSRKGFINQLWITW